MAGGSLLIKKDVDANMIGGVAGMSILSGLFGWDKPHA